jgi:hypothetical protein
VGEQGVQEGTKNAPLRGPRVEDVLLPTLTTWGWPFKKSRIQFQREVYSPRVLRLVMNFVGTMVLRIVQCGVRLRLRHLWICWGGM